MTTPTTTTVLRRFPLIGRPRPACRALPERVTDVIDLAHAAEARNPDALTHAANALNLAALIASDCGLPGLATAWCWAHIDRYLDQPTLTMNQAAHLLEPVLNLARLQIRANSGQPALTLLRDMYRAVTKTSDLTINGRPIPLSRLDATTDEHHTLRRWAWLQYLNDGIRILALNDQWETAAAHATALNGIGIHLLEGRQAAILAHCPTNPAAAQDLLAESTLTETWEREVHACLTAICTTGAQHDAAMTIATQLFLDQTAPPEHIAYHTRLGLTIAALVEEHHPDAANHIIRTAADRAIAAGDGYASRDLLHHQTAHPLPDAQQSLLQQLITDAGLGRKFMPASAQELLTGAVRSASTTLAAALTSTSRDTP
jgi:hypothetical protein